MKGIGQTVMHCPCGNSKVLALGVCATCYSLKRQDEEHFGGMREAVLERDGYRCRVCDASGRDKRSIVVHHRIPGRSVLKLMISLCPSCHAKVHRTKAALSLMPPLLLQLWREQHPKGHEQVNLDFAPQTRSAQVVPLFGHCGGGEVESLKAAEKPPLMPARTLVARNLFDSGPPLL